MDRTRRALNGQGCKARAKPACTCCTPQRLRLALLPAWSFHTGEMDAPLPMERLYDRCLDISGWFLPTLLV